MQVMAYCMNDVLITYLIYLRWSATHGGAAAALDAYERALTWAKQHSVLGEGEGWGAGGGEGEGAGP